MNTNRGTVTSGIETETSPEVVLQVLSDPRRLPEWAPGFADRVQAGAGGCWMITKGEKTFPIEVVTFGPALTVDYLREVAPGKKGGAFLRVLPQPRGGCVIVMTLPVPPGATAEGTATILDQELQLLTALCASL
jgi:hypothetical protein